jgi:hypothetical protein
MSYQLTLMERSLAPRSPLRSSCRAIACRTDVFASAVIPLGPVFRVRRLAHGQPCLAHFDALSAIPLRGIFVLALAYRIPFNIAGSYVAARLAPTRPMRHALALGVLGLVISTLAAVAMWEPGPAWYSLANIAIALPCAWAGGRFRGDRIAALRHAKIRGPKVALNFDRAKRNLAAR